MDIHDFTVCIDTPISPAKLDALSICPVLPAHSLTNFLKSNRFLVHPEYA